MLLTLLGIGLIGLSFMVKKESKDRKRYLVLGSILFIGGLIMWVTIGGL
jgi:hypothetical protein